MIDTLSIYLFLFIIKTTMATKASPQERSRLDGVGRHTQQYNMNAETVDKKLNVLDVLEKTKDMRATILRFYPNISEVAHKSKRNRFTAEKKRTRNCALQPKPTRAVTVRFATKVRRRYSAMIWRMRLFAL